MAKELLFERFADLVPSNGDENGSVMKRSKHRSKSSESTEICRATAKILSVVEPGITTDSSFDSQLNDLDIDFRFYQQYRHVRQVGDVSCEYFGIGSLAARILRRYRSQSAGRVHHRRHHLPDILDEEAECIELRQINDDIIVRGRQSRMIDEGHHLVPVRVTAVLWCDKCGQSIVSIYRQCFVCKFCQFTCHDHCRQLITVRCPLALAGISRGRRPSRIQTETSLTQYSALWSSANLHESDEPDASEKQTSPILCEDMLQNLITKFNKNNLGLCMELEDENDSLYSGFIRIYMNLCRPITMCVSVPPPSAVLTHSEPGHDDLTHLAHLTSFYMPRGTSRVIHVTSKTTTQDVIRTLLGKFNITDNPRKFMLYERTYEDDLKRAFKMRRLQADETPLVLYLHWTDMDGIDKLDRHQFVLQENDPGEIMWEIFSVPELENFLAILNLEERENINSVHTKYFRKRVLFSRRVAELSKQQTK